MARIKKWLKVGPEFGHDRPQERNRWAMKKKWIAQEVEVAASRELSGGTSAAGTCQAAAAAGGATDAAAPRGAGTAGAARGGRAA